MESNWRVQTVEKSADVIEVIVIPDDPLSQDSTIVPSVSLSRLSPSSPSGCPDQAFSDISLPSSSTASIDSSNVSASTGERKRKISPGCSYPDPQKPKLIFVAVKQGSPTDHELEELGNKIAEKWKILGRRLGFKEPKLQDIDQGHRELSEKGYHMLRGWKQEYGSAATYETLSVALEHELVQRKDLAEKICFKNDGESNIKIEVEYLKEVQFQRAPATSLTEGSVSHSGTEDPQVLITKVLCLIARKYLQTNPFKPREFMEYMKKMKLIITGVSVGSLVITVKCESLQILEELWADYSSGHLGTMVQNCFVTEKILKEMNLSELKLKTTMDVEEYNARKVYFERVANRDVGGTIFKPFSHEVGGHREVPGSSSSSAIMSGIITAVFKATIGWLVDKGRDKAAGKLQSGDVTDQQFRDIIMREIDVVRSKLHALSQKDLSASISFFREGIALLYEAFEDTRPSSECGADRAQAAFAEVVSLTEGMRNLEITGSAATRKLANAKKRFERARERATEAFSNEALPTSDRILAMQYRVMSTVLETIDNPADAVATCKVCIEELNGLPTVQQSLKVQLKTGIRVARGWIKKGERQKLLTEICRVNRVAYDVTQIVSAKEPLPQWSMVDTGEEKVNLLLDKRVTEVLRKQGMENCSLLWILGQDGKEEQKINKPLDVASNSSGQYIVIESDLTIKVFDNNGKFVEHFRLPPLIDDSGNELLVADGQVRLATDINDNIYVLVTVKELKDSYWIFKFNKTADQHYTFLVGRMSYKFNLFRLSVSDSGKVVVLRSDWRKRYSIVDVHETDGQFVCSFGEQILNFAQDITTVNDDRVMVVDQSPFVDRVHIFSEQGEYLSKFDLRGSPYHPRIAYHKESQQVVVPAGKKSSTRLWYIGIYTKDGEFVRSTLIHVEKLTLLDGITVTPEGRIAVAANQYGSFKVIII